MRPVPLEPCLGLLHAFEKGPDGTFAATPYKDAGGYWTMGWGHRVDGPGMVWTQERADSQALLDLDTAAQGVTAALGDVVQRLTEGQYAACIDFTFNEGVGRFGGSTFSHLIRVGNFVLAPKELARWVYGRNASGVEVVMPGLVRRREAELAVWNAG